MVDLQGELTNSRMKKLVTASEYFSGLPAFVAKRLSAAAILAVASSSDEASSR
jgi:hypothetical protein